MYNITVDEENRARGCNNLDIPLEELLAKPMTDQALGFHGDDDDGSGDDDDADHDDNDADGNNDRGDMFFSQVVNCGHNLYSPEGETTSGIIQVQSQI